MRINEAQTNKSNVYPNKSTFLFQVKIIRSRAVGSKCAARECKKSAVLLIGEEKIKKTHLQRKALSEVKHEADGVSHGVEGDSGRRKPSTDEETLLKRRDASVLRCSFCSSWHWSSS